MPAPLPRQPAPALDLPLVGGGRFDLAAASPDQFALVVVYRGVHCPQCKKQLSELDGRLGELRDVGVDEVVAVSGDDRERAEQAVREWELNNLRVAYGMEEAAMRAWGLYVSKGITDREPSLFAEPGLFLVRPDASLYSAHVQSTPFARPRLDDLLKAVAFVREKDYPARGEA
ncbi:MAG: AhpC/TSA family protein [Actinobacteria bacterium]|nr:AhpC/TSA family protein [Actinomycetota bacterium]MCA1722164.1 AhpC/TSA family protein [Actinomycetota bacterium]